MLHALPEVFAAAAMPRLVLLLNHVLVSEPVATERLRRHGGRRLSLRLTGWPALLPAPPVVRLLITPAGLLEWIERPLPAESGMAVDSGSTAADGADLDIAVDAANPAGLLARGLIGERPAVVLSGDAALATDLSWVADNVRWDIRDDLSRLFGERPASALARAASALANGLRSTAQGLMAKAAAGGRAARPAGPGDAFGDAAQSPAQ